MPASSQSSLAAAQLTSQHIKHNLPKTRCRKNWIQRINLDPNIWTKNADKWFYTDQPRDLNEYGVNAPANAAITAMMVRVPQFNSIVVSGPYRIEIYGRQMRNSLYILGPNEAARHVAVEIKGSVLNIHPASDCTKSSCGNDQVIVRIGMNELNNLVVNGTNFVEGKDITSRNLTVKSNGNNQVLLTGIMNVTCVTQSGAGTISIIGAYSPNLDLFDYKGNINISGHVGVRNIVKQGAGCINVIGMDTDSLKINSTGSGIVALAGYANLRKAVVKQSSHVYLYWVNSNGIYITLGDSARLGLAGSAKNIELQASGSSRFEGKYLHADSMYVTTRDTAHANVYPQSKLFANASEYSSIYFFGSPNVVSRYTNGSGIIVPIFNDTCPTPAPFPMTGCRTPRFKGEPAPMGYKDEGNFRGYMNRNQFETKQARKESNSMAYTNY